jgi:starch synthase
MKVALLSREYPPDVYGGAGVHVEHLAAQLARLTDLEVHCFGAERPASADRNVIAYQPWDHLRGDDRHLEVLRTMSIDLAMAAALSGTDVVHSHTWYTSLAGHLAKLLYDVPHVVTVHSLEPKRPWKVDQLGTGYRLSSFCERAGIESADAVIAVSGAAAQDITTCYPAVDPGRITVIHNAVDIDEWRRDPRSDVLESFGIDPGRPIVMYVGRITHQKGITHLLAAARSLDPSAQLVLRAGPADTPELARQAAAQISALAAQRDGVIWIEESLDPRQLNQLLSHATVSCCPSVYEPFGLVNLEAMACGASVVASAVGGIPEIVEDEVTGKLVPFEPMSSCDSDPADPERFARDLADAINELVADPQLASRMGEAGRRRVVQRFSWPESAHRTFELYRSLGARANLSSAAG